MNVTNELYKGLNIVSSNSNNKIIYGKPNVMIWDQFNKNFDTIKKNYDRGLWTATLVRIAVRKGIITKDEYTKITGESY